ncbi:MAG: ABC transporter permease subunit [Clostridia bacterium]
MDKKLDSTNKKQRIYNILFPLIAVIFLLIVWGVTSKIVGLELLFPSIGSAFGELGKLLGDSSFYLALANSLARALIAFVCAFVFGLALAILSFSFGAIEKLLNPIISIMRSIPTMSILLLTLIWLDAFSSPILMAFFVIFPIIYTNVLGSLNGIDKSLIDMSKLFCVGKKTLITKLYIPSISASIFSSIRSTLSLTLKLIIAGEVFAQTAKSIGLNMYLGQIYLETAKLFAWTIVAIVLGGILEAIVAIISKIVEKKCYGN